MNKVQHVKWCMKQTKLTSEICCPTDCCLAQLVRYWPEDREILVSIPTGGNFGQIYFCSSLRKDLSDNLTETPILKNSIVMHIAHLLKVLTMFLWPRSCSFSGKTGKEVIYCQIKLYQIFDKYLPSVQYYLTKTFWNLCQFFNKSLAKVEFNN